MNNDNTEEKEIKKVKSVKWIIIKYSITIAICISITIAILFIRNFTNVTPGTKEFYRVLADSFTMPGLIYILIATLIFLINEGSLSALGYMGRTIVRTLNPHYKKDKMTYYEYSRNRKKIRGYSCILWVGLAFFVVGIVFLILFYTA